MNRKFLAKILAASMVLTAAPAIPCMEADAEELGIGSQTGGYLGSVTSKRTAVETPDITTGLVGYYGFDDSLGNSASGTGGSATVHGGAGDTWNSPASGSAVYSNSKDHDFGKAYQFSGDTGTAEGGDFVRGEGLELDVKMPKTFTISYWVNPDTVNSATSMVFSPVTKDKGMNIADNWFGKSFPTVRIWGFGTSDKDDSYLDNFIDSADALCGKWSHITLTCDASGSYSLYVNGAKAGESKINVAAANDLTGNPIFLGVNFWDASFDGLMDEVYIYNRALSSEDVAELYKAGKIPTDQIPEPGDSGDTGKPGDTGEPGTDFSNISTQPVVKYTFDNTEGLELAGEAKASDGVLNLATEKTYGKTYAKIADLSSFDFSNGITLTADVKVTGWETDWTPIFMLGDGKLGGEKNGCTLAYHFTQGFSSRDDVSETGYFGNGISAPYTWDWYNSANNRNRWDTLVVTINDNKMVTYINGQCVQSLDGDYTKLISALKGAKNNYLGASYWSSDADFQGSLDNVGIYNAALAAEDIAKLTSTKNENVVITTPKPLAPYPIVLPTAAPTPVPTAAPTLPPSDDEESEGIELECGTFWTAWTLGTEVTESGTAITFKNTTNASATDNWNTPAIVAYSASEPKVNADGYKEYVYIRADNWAWNPAGDKEASSWASSGYSMTNNMDSSFDWASWLAANKAGTDCKVQAIKTDGKVVIETTVAGLTTITTFPVADGEKVYISLTGEQCKLTNIKTAAYTGISGITANPSESATPAPSADPEATPDPEATAEPGSTEAPGTTDPGTNPGDKDPGTTDPGTNNPDSEKPSDGDNENEDKETKKTMKVSDITAKAGKKKVTGKLSVKGTKVTVKVGNKKYKNAKVNGKKFTFTASSKLKKGTKVTIKVTKSGYKAVTKTVKVK